MRACIDLLTKHNYIDSSLSLRERYETAVGVYNIERNDSSMWNMIYNHEIQSLFQMEQQSGIKGIAAVHPSCDNDLAALNSVIRLMAPEKGAEQPIEKFARFKANPSLWYEEMNRYGISKHGQEVLESIIGVSYGLCIFQEQFMMLVQQPELGGFSLLWADRLRKAISKKNPAEYDKLTKEFFEITKEKNCEANLCNYTWNILIAMNKGYGFNAAHTLAYSIVALQEMNLAFKYPIIFWNTANLIVDSGAMNLEDEFFEELDDYEEDDCEENEEIEDEEKKKKIKNSSTDYGKIASAIGNMESKGINFSLPNINQSEITFSPDVQNNRILYGLKGISKVGNSFIKNIIENRPYTSIEDFISKIKIKKPQMISLIKAGTFDELYVDKTREEIMNLYIEMIADKKNRITLQNMMSLIKYNLIPPELIFEQKLYNFNKYIKKFKEDNYYRLDTLAMNFFENNYNTDILENVVINGEEKTGLINQKIWDNTYKKGMDPVRDWIKANQTDILNQLNNILKEEVAEKYTEGNISKWEMDSLSFYYHEHELSSLRNDIYGIDDYFNLPDEPEVDRTFESKNGDNITIYKIHRIAGTVIDKNKNKSMITLLTPTGVVRVKVWKSQFSAWDKRIFMKLDNGKKKVLENSWFTRGTKLIITGIKRENTFIPKKYKNTEWPLFEKIIELDDKGFITDSQTERIEVE